MAAKVPKTNASIGRGTISFASGNELDVRKIEKKHAEDFEDYGKLHP